MISSRRWLSSQGAIDLIGSTITKAITNNNDYPLDLIGSTITIANNNNYPLDLIGSTITITITNNNDYPPSQGAIDPVGERIYSLEQSEIAFRELAAGGHKVIFIRSCFYWQQGGTRWLLLEVVFIGTVVLSYHWNLLRESWLSGWVKVGERNIEVNNWPSLDSTLYSTLDKHLG